jgi:hypothetical protein
LIDCRRRLGQHDQAETLRRKSLALVKARDGPASLTYAAALFDLGFNLLQQRKYADAEAVLRECLTILQSKNADMWQTFGTRSLLGQSLLGEKKYAAAEPLLLQGYEGMKQRQEAIPRQAKIQLKKALEGLVQLYENWNRPAEAAKWRNLLQQGNKP